MVSRDTCRDGHSWTGGWVDPELGSSVRCGRCGHEERKPPPPPSSPIASTAQQAAAQAGRLSPAGPGSSLTVADLGHLRLAGKWGLLRSQAGVRFMLTGMFSMPSPDLMRLIEAAGGLVPLDGSINDGSVDALVVGEDATKEVIDVARANFVDVLTEAELVGRLLPSLVSLQAEPGQPPF